MSMMTKRCTKVDTSQYQYYNNNNNININNYNVMIFLLVFLNVASCCMASAQQRLGHSTVILRNGTMVIYGGHNYFRTDYDGKTYDSLLGDMWMFDFQSGNWTQILPNNISVIPQARWYHTAIPSTRNGQDTMVVFGGVTYIRYDGTRSTTFLSCGRKDVWEFNFDTLTWSLLQDDSGMDCSGVGRLGTDGLWLGIVVGVVGLVLFG